MLKNQPKKPAVSVADTKRNQKIRKTDLIKNYENNEYCKKNKQRPEGTREQLIKMNEEVWKKYRRENQERKTTRQTSHQQKV